MTIRWWSVPRSSRYYVESVTGYEINPRRGGQAAGGSDPPGTTWSVFDAYVMHQEVASFTPRGGRTSVVCREMANRLCAELNEEEAAANLVAQQVGA